MTRKEIRLNDQVVSKGWYEGMIQTAREVKSTHSVQLKHSVTLLNVNAIQNIENVNPIILQVPRCFADGTTFKAEVNLKSHKKNSKFCFYLYFNHKVLEFG